MSEHPSTNEAGTVVETARGDEEREKEHWAQVAKNEQRLRGQRRMVEKALGRRIYRRG